MDGYEFMAQNPVLTIILSLIGGVTAKELAKCLFGEIYRTHPTWGEKAVKENILNSGITKKDVSDMIKHCDTLDDLRKELTDYFDLENYD